MENMEMNLSFFRDKVVLVTGHTGFKGSWLSQILILLGAKVIGYSLNPLDEPNLFSFLHVEKEMVSIIGDIRDYEKLNAVFRKYKPSIVFHLAAQPIVRESFRNPRYTYDVNVMGTVNVCECVRNNKSVKSFVNVTTDKVYENSDIPNHPFKEEEKLNGFDPYSNSKSCSELVTDSYRKSFYGNMDVRVSTARAGNVIGGGDFSADRIIPDSVRALQTKNSLIMRNPNSIRPYQHVLESLRCYLLIAERQNHDIKFCGSYNIGPNLSECVTTKELIDLLSACFSQGVTYHIQSDNGPHESSFLQLDNSKMKKVFGWEPTLGIHEATKLTAEWYECYLANEDLKKITIKQIKDYFRI